MKELLDNFKKFLNEEKKMTKKQIKKRDKIAKSISTKGLEDRYDVDKEEAENIKFAIATKTAMKEAELEEQDQDGDGDEDFADVMMARMKASGMSDEEAKKKTRKHDETSKKK